MKSQTTTQRASRARAIIANLGLGHSIPRDGWPALPDVPDSRHRKSDKPHWNPEGPDDPWKRAIR